MNRFWKNKKIIAYIALAHHTRFITPVMEALASQGAQIRYIVGQAERSQEMTAIDLGLDYAHLFDFVSKEDRDDIQNNYDILCQTFSTGLKNDFPLGLLPVTVTDKTLHATAREYVGFQNLFKKERPDLCFALHELNRWGKMFAFRAKKENIPFFTLQEGLTYNLDFGLLGHVQYSTLNLVWGERVKRKMVGFDAPAEKIIPVGNTHLATEIEFQEKQGVRHKKRKAYGVTDDLVALLILSSLLPDPALFTPIFKTVSETRGLGIFVKFHPACKRSMMDKWKEEVKSRFKHNIRFIHTRENTYDLISISDVCVLGQRSTTGLESVAFGKPLVKLDFAYKKNAPYSFVDQGVAVKMSAEELSLALAEKTDFSRFISMEKRKKFLEQELKETTGTVRKVIHIFKKAVEANTSVPVPFEGPCPVSDKKWSIFLEVPDNPSLFLAQLEAVSVNSEGQGEYEILVLEPEEKGKELTRILDSLEGDVKRIVLAKGENRVDLMNRTVQNARGEMLVFFEKNLAPLAGWLESLSNAFLKHGDDKVFGARISSRNGKIAHAGMTVDRNNTPVPAYRHLNMEFPAASKERSFQMVDHFIAMKKECFYTIGGFTPESGNYLFLDFCLKALQTQNDPDAVIYLPGLTLIFLDRVEPKKSQADATYFYGKWSFCLWESETRLHREDKVSKKDLAHAGITAAMESSV